MWYFVDYFVFFLTFYYYSYEIDAPLTLYALGNRVFLWDDCSTPSIGFSTIDSTWRHFYRFMLPMLHWRVQSLILRQQIPFEMVRMVPFFVGHSLIFFRVGNMIKQQKLASSNRIRTETTRMIRFFKFNHHLFGARNLHTHTSTW